MTIHLKRWLLGMCLGLVLAIGYAPAAEAQVVVVGPRYHHRYYHREYYRRPYYGRPYYRHSYYRHHHRYYRGYYR